MAISAARVLRGRSLPSRARVPALFAALALAAAGCGAPEYRYVKSSETNTFLKVPRDWAGFEEDEILDLQAELSRQAGRPQTAEDRRIAEAIQWRVAFDSDPKPSLRHILLLADKPTIDATVRVLLPGERDVFSNSSLRNLFLDYDSLKQQQLSRESGDIEALVDSDFRPIVEAPIENDHVRGVHLVFNIRARDGKVYTFDQTALVDSRTRLLYTLLIVAEESEYRAESERIREVARSFTVKAKD